MSNFPIWWAFCQSPERDGLADDSTTDGAGVTRWGWTFPTWRNARVYTFGVTASTDFSDFVVMTQADAGVLALHYFWDRLGGRELPSGVDISFMDWVWNSGRAIIEVQYGLGVWPDGVLGPETLAAMCAPVPALMIQRIHDWRVQYYDVEGFRTRFPGLYDRADAVLGLAKTLVSSPPVEGAPVA
jgi:lysozyme family protein